MVHGFLMKPEFHHEKFSPVTEAFTRAGYKVHLAQTPSLHTIGYHANVLIEQILRDIPPGKDIVLVGHSQGGLVSRLATQRLQSLSQKKLKGRKVISVQTIGTPHHGYLDTRLPRLDESQKKIVEKSKPVAPRIIHKFFEVGTEMSPSEMESFNKFVPNVEGVYYASITNKVPKLSPLKYIRGANTDGLIGNNSSKWGTVIKINSNPKPPGNHIDQVYNITGKYRPAMLNGNALVAYTEDVTMGRVSIDAAEYDYKSQPSFKSIGYRGLQIIRALQCLTGGNRIPN